MNIADALSMWVIYDHPRDYPNSFVARQQFATADGIYHSVSVIVGDTLEEVREQLPRGLWPMARCEHDDPVIVETWM